MPTYCYRKDSDGSLVELEMGIEQMMAREVNGRIQLDDGTTATRDWSPGSVAQTRRPSCWPMVSHACGCHPKQIAEMREFLGKRGIKTEYTSDGKAIFRSPRHRRAHARALGMRDFDAGYSDP